MGFKADWTIEHLYELYEIIVSLEDLQKTVFVTATGHIYFLKSVSPCVTCVSGKAINELVWEPLVQLNNGRVG